MLEGNSNIKLESGAFAFPNIPSYAVGWNTFSVLGTSLIGGLPYMGYWHYISK